jgi:hypothetical protein
MEDLTELEEWVYMILLSLINEPTKENAKIIAKAICAGFKK